MWGVEFERGGGGDGADRVGTDDEKRRDEAKRKGGRVVGWSDKGTVHVWESEEEVEAKRV